MAVLFDDGRNERVCSLDSIAAPSRPWQHHHLYVDVMRCEGVGGSTAASLIQHRMRGSRGSLQSRNERCTGNSGTKKLSSHHRCSAGGAWGIQAWPGHVLDGDCMIGGRNITHDRAFLTVPGLELDGCYSGAARMVYIVN